MEMPEGLEKLLEENHKIGSFNLKYSLKVFNAINLMKEMAEALEELYTRTGEYNDRGPRGETYPSDELFELRIKIEELLDKFKEWK